ncbi:MAG: hypothetical protein WBP79_16480 [Candidatus Acidiferrales bacterium]
MDAETIDGFDLCVELVEAIAWKCFQGYLPSEPEIIAMALIHCVPALRDAPEQVTQRFVDQLLPVLCRRIAIQDAALIVAFTERPN